MNQASLGLVVGLAVGFVFDGAVRAQDEVAAAIARFGALDFRHKATIVRTLQRQLAQLDLPAAQRIRALGVEPEAAEPARDTPRIHDPAEWAKREFDAGRAPARRVVPADTDEHAKVAARFARPQFLPELRAEVRYDWATGTIVRGAPLDYDALFANAAHGFAPGTDAALARILQELDRSVPEQSAPGAWFEHVYCDLDARAYPPVTLYDAWYSGRIVDVPDVDAIAFARLVLGDRRLESPLSGAPRDRLYAAIRDAALRYRVHRTTCEAAAGAFVAAEPPMDPLYALLVPRFHYLWATLGDDPAALAKKLGKTDRTAILDEVDAKIRGASGTDFEIREGRKRELATMHGEIRTLALATLERLGG